MTPRSSEVGRPGNVTIVRRGGSKLDGGMIAEVLGRIADDDDYPDWIGAWASAREPREDDNDIVR